MINFTLKKATLNMLNYLYRNKTLGFFFPQVRGVSEYLIRLKFV